MASIGVGPRPLRRIAPTFKNGGTIMSDPIACLKLTLTPNTLLSPIATAENLSQCLGKGPQKAGVKALQAAASAAGAMVAGKAAGKLARSAVRFGAKAGAVGSNKGTPSISNATQSGGKSSCISPIELSLGALLPPLYGIRRLLISPLGTPEGFPKVCTPDQDPHIQTMIRGSKTLSDVGADILLDVMGPGPGLWMAEQFGL